MRQIIRIFVVFFALVVVIYIVKAQITGTYKPEDYRDPNVYQNPNFYKISNPGLWDFKLVNWKYVDFSRKDVYGYQAFYDNLPYNKWSSLNYKLIDNYDLIRDHDKIDGNKYIKDMVVKIVNSAKAMANLKHGVLTY